MGPAHAGDSGQDGLGDDAMSSVAAPVRVVVGRGQGREGGGVADDTVGAQDDVRAASKVTRLVRLGGGHVAASLTTNSQADNTYWVF